MLAARYLYGVALLSSAVVFLSCNDSPTETGEERIPAALDIVSGDGQEGTVGTELSDPLVVRVEDANGLPVIGQLVNFRVTSGGGSVFAGSGLTNALGIVQDRWTLGTSMAQDQRVEARAVDPNTGAAIVFATFRATAKPGPAHSVAKAGGDGQQGALGTALAESLAVRVTDSFGNPIPGVPVAWAVSAGNGAVSPASSQTNAQGIAKTRWTVGARLDTPHAVTATVGTLTPVAFAATTTLPSTATIVKVAGDGASARVATALPDSLAVRVQLAGGEPVAGATVTWSVTGGGGTVSPQSSVTQSDGIARTRLTLGTVSGANVVSASVPGLAAASIAVTATPDVPATVTKIGGDGQTGVVAQLLGGALIIRVLDQYDNPVPNAAVAWTPSAGTVTPGVPTTNASGEASATWTLGQTTGPHTLSATVGGLPAAQFSAIARAGTVSSLTVVSGGGQSATSGSTLPTLLQVQAQDSFGNSVSDASITFVASDGGSFSPGTATTDAGGNAASQWTLGPTAGTQTAAMSHGNVSVTTTATATTGTAALLGIVSGNAQAGIAGDPLAQPLVVRVTDANSNPVTGVAVTWAAGSQCGAVSSASSSTDAAGLSQTNWTLGTSGRLCSGGVTASLTGGASVTFTARFLGRTAQLIDPGNLVEQIGTIDVPVVLSATVTDNSENPVPGVTVNWSRTEGNGSLATSSSVTDSVGRAIATFTPGTLAGNNRVAASVNGLTAAEYLVWTRALTPERVIIVSGNNQTGELGQALAQPPSIRVVDSYGNGVYDEPVTFRVVRGGGHVERTSLRTDQSGAASTIWVLGAAGLNEVEATSNGSTAIFSATGTNGTREGLLIVEGNEQTFTVSMQGTYFTQPMAVRVVDAQGQPVSGVPVTWRAALSEQVVVSDAAGLSRSSGLRLDIVSGGAFPVTATLPNGVVARLSVIAVPAGGATAVVSITGSPSARVGRRLPGRVVLGCTYRLGGAAPCSLRTTAANFTGYGGELIPAPGLFPPGVREYFWILPETPGTYYVVTSTGNHASATATR